MLQMETDRGQAVTDDKRSLPGEDNSDRLAAVISSHTADEPLAQSISHTIEETLSRERADIAADSAYALEQRETLEAKQRAELTRRLTGRGYDQITAGSFSMAACNTAAGARSLYVRSWVSLP